MHVYDTGAGDSICHASVYGLIKKKKDEKTESTCVYGVCGYKCIYASVRMYANVCMYAYIHSRTYVCIHTL